jgi:hypothetical protein
VRNRRTQDLDAFAKPGYDSFTINFSHMSELTLKAIEQLLIKELKPIKSGMAALATSEELGSVNTRLGTVETILNQHTVALDQVLGQKKTREDESSVATARFERLEHWAQLVGKKLGITLDL